MFKLTDVDSDFYLWNGVNIELNLSFDNVLKVHELFNDKEVNKTMKLDIALEMLVVNSELLKQLNQDHAYRLILDILKDKLEIDLSDNSIEQTEELTLDDLPIYDFEEDAGYIYASFLFDYKIDLFEQQGKLNWYRFKELFKNLSTESPMGQAFHYRTCEIPKKDTHNADERKRIKKMKEKYELQSTKKMREEIEFRTHQERMNRMKQNL